MKWNIFKILAVLLGASYLAGAGVWVDQGGAGLPGPPGPPGSGHFDFWDTNRWSVGSDSRRDGGTNFFLYDVLNDRTVFFTEGGFIRFGGHNLTDIGNLTMIGNLRVTGSVIAVGALPSFNGLSINVNEGFFSGITLGGDRRTTWPETVGQIISNGYGIVSTLIGGNPVTNIVSVVPGTFGARGETNDWIWKNRFWRDVWVFGPLVVSNNFVVVGNATVATNLTVGGRLGVGGTATFGQAVWVGGPMTVSNTLVVTDSATISRNGTLVTGTLIADSIIGPAVEGGVASWEGMSSNIVVSMDVVGLSKSNNPVTRTHHVFGVPTTVSNLTDGTSYMVIRNRGTLNTDLVFTNTSTGTTHHQIALMVLSGDTTNQAYMLTVPRGAADGGTGRVELWPDPAFLSGNWMPRLRLFTNQRFLGAGLEWRGANVGHGAGLLATSAEGEQNVQIAAPSGFGHGLFVLSNVRYDAPQTVIPRWYHWRTNAVSQFVIHNVFDETLTATGPTSPQMHQRFGLVYDRPARIGMVVAGLSNDVVGFAFAMGTTTNAASHQLSHPTRHWSGFWRAPGYGSTTWQVPLVLRDETNGLWAAVISTEAPSQFQVRRTNETFMTSYALTQTVLSNSIEVTVTNLNLPSSNYAVSALPSWNTTVWWSEKTTNYFKLHFGTAPNTNQQVDVRIQHR